MVGVDDALEDPVSDTFTKPPGDGPGTTHEQVAASEDFAALKRTFRTFIFPMTALFLVWYFLYVLLAAFAPGFMGTPVFGNVNLGLLFGLGQFVSTFAITMAYRSWANKKYDHAAEQLRARIEGGAA